MSPAIPDAVQGAGAPPGAGLTHAVLGAGLLVHGRLSDADRELVIARVAARAGCAYEWGVHMATYAEAAGLTPRQVTLTATGGPDHPAWSRQTALLRAVDELHDTARVGDAAWSGLREHLDEPEVLELLVLAGWYRTIAYVANGARITRTLGARPAGDGPLGRLRGGEPSAADSAACGLRPPAQTSAMMTMPSAIRYQTNGMKLLCEMNRINHAITA